jgi:hypothetical protein
MFKAMILLALLLAAGRKKKKLPQTPVDVPGRGDNAGPKRDGTDGTGGPKRDGTDGEAVGPVGRRSWGTPQYGRVAGKDRNDRPARTVDNRRAVLQTLMQIAWRFTPYLGEEIKKKYKGWDESYRRYNAEYQQTKRLLEDARTHRQLSIAARNLVGMYAMPVNALLDTQGALPWGMQQLMTDLLIAKDVDRLSDPTFHDDLLRFAGSRGFEPQPTKGWGDECQFVDEDDDKRLARCQRRLEILEHLKTRTPERIAQAVLEWVPENNWRTLDLDAYMKEHSWFGQGRPTWEKFGKQLLKFALGVAEAYTGIQGAIDVDTLIPPELAKAMTAVEKNATTYAEMAGVDPSMFLAGMQAIKGADSYVSSKL